MSETRHNIATLGWQLLQLDPALQHVFHYIEHMRHPNWTSPFDRVLINELITGIAIGKALASSPEVLVQLGAALLADCEYELSMIRNALSHDRRAISQSTLQTSKAEATAAILAMIGGGKKS